MCLIAFAYLNHPRYRLIMVANRDEFYHRSTEPAHYWHDGSGIIAGKDNEAGGTWLGLHPEGRLAAVTNFRDGSAPQSSTALSRGNLTTDFLRHNTASLAAAKSILANGQAYNGFNLLLADRDELAYCSNRSDAAKRLEPGVYTLSNHLLNTPWPKSRHASEALSALITEEEINTDALISCLSSRAPFPDEQLPSTGIEFGMERALSPPFIVTPEYGTRCTTALLWSHDGTIEMVEQNYLPGGEEGVRKGFQVACLL